MIDYLGAVLGAGMQSVFLQIFEEKQNNYKQNLAKRKMEKRGQLSIFIIIAVVIVVAGILLYFFYPDIKTAISGSDNPQEFLQDCIDETVTQGVETLSKQGGYADPEGFALYNNEKIKYLCYESRYYLPCKVQQPSIKRHFETELETILQSKTQECVQELKAIYEQKGYSVSVLSEARAEVSIIPEKMSITINAPMTLSKDTTQTFQNFVIERKSKLFDLLTLTTSVIDFESSFGDTDTRLYIQYYPNLDIQKKELDDGTTIYTLSDVTTNEYFTFASRSLAWPGGYGFEA